MAKADKSDGKASKKRTLAVNVAVRGEWYGPAHGNADSVPDEVAEQIGDDAWA
jgi:hypothetical protein